MSGLQQLMMSNFSGGGAGNEAFISPSSVIVPYSITTDFQQELVYVASVDRFVAYYTGNNSGPNLRRAVCRVIQLNDDDSITLGPEYLAGGLDDDYITAVYDYNADKLVLIYRDDADAEKIKARVAIPTTSNTISFGPVAIVDGSGDLAEQAATFDPIQNKILVQYEDDKGADSMLGVVLTANANNTISVGAKITIQAGNQSWGDPNTRSGWYGNGVHIAPYEYSRMRAVAVSGTSMSVGPEFVLPSMNTNERLYSDSTGVYVPSTNRHYVATGDNTAAPFKRYIRALSNTGTTLTYHGKTSMWDGSYNSFFSEMVYDSDFNILAAAVGKQDNVSTLTSLSLIEMTPDVSGMTVLNEIDIEPEVAGYVNSISPLDFVRKGTENKYLIGYSKDFNYHLKVYKPTGWT